jgi:hypothetical protein
MLILKQNVKFVTYNWFLHTTESMTTINTVYQHHLSLNTPIRFRIERVN